MTLDTSTIETVFNVPFLLKTAVMNERDTPATSIAVPILPVFFPTPNQSISRVMSSEIIDIKEKYFLISTLLIQKLVPSSNTTPKICRCHSKNMSYLHEGETKKSFFGTSRNFLATIQIAPSMRGYTNSKAKTIITS